MSANGSGLLVIERILRDRQSIWQQIVQDRDLPRFIGTMLASSAVALACYGAVLGAFHSVLMAATSAVKLPLLFLMTLAICLPTLYLFNLVFGARLSVRQTLALVMVAITVTSLLAVAFAPISLFFLITARDYGFFKLLNVAILALSALVGLRFLTGGMRVLNAHGLLTPADRRGPATSAPVGAPTGPIPAQAGTAAPDAPGQPTPGQPTPGQPVPALTGAPAGAAHSTVPNGAAPEQATAPAASAPAGFAQPGHAQQPGYPQQLPVALPAHRPLPSARTNPAVAERSPSMTLLYVWILLFGFVGTQLAWTLRPFFGSPGEGFAFFRSIEGNFYAEILRTLSSLF